MYVRRDLNPDDVKVRDELLKGCWQILVVDIRILPCGGEPFLGGRGVSIYARLEAPANMTGDALGLKGRAFSERYHVAPLALLLSNYLFLLMSTVFSEFKVFEKDKSRHELKSIICLSMYFTVVYLV